MPTVGLKKLYYATVTDTADTLTFGTPVYLPGIQELGISPKQNTEKQYAEDQLWDQMTALEEIEVTVNVANLTNAMKATLLGYTVASEGGIYAKSSDVAPYVALLYKAPKSNDETRYGVLYKGKFTLPEDSMKGIENGKIEFKSPVLKCTFQPLKNNEMWEYKVDTDDDNCPSDIDDTWFTEVIVPSTDTTAPTITSVPLDAAAGVAVDADVVLTSDKALSNGTVNSNNVFLMQDDGTAVACTLSLDSTKKIITLNPTSSLSAMTSYIAVVTTGVKSVTNVALAANLIVNFTTV